jgi:hypothetical protein
MLEENGRAPPRERRLRELVKESLAADQAIDRGGDVYLAADVHAWLDRLASGLARRRPKPWRGPSRRSVPTKR